MDLHQQRFNCSGLLTCPAVTIPIIDNEYLFGTGTGGGNITAVATLNPEPNSRSLLLGGNVGLPFTSEPFDTTGFSSIIITAGQLGSEHLTAMSLQRIESGVFVEKHRLSCDGGAECPVTSLPLLGGNYRVVVEGSGMRAVVGALIRP